MTAKYDPDKLIRYLQRSSFDEIDKEYWDTNMTGSSALQILNALYKIIEKHGWTLDEYRKEQSRRMLID